MSRTHFRVAAAALALSTLASAQVVQILPTKDNTLYEDATGSLSNGAGTTLYCGRTGFFGGSAVARRALFHFDVAGNAPAGTAVIYADLTLQCSQGQGGNAQLQVHRLTAAFGEGSSDAGVPGGGGAPAATGDATWTNTFYPSSNWTTPGGDFVAGFSAKTTVSGPGTYVWGPTPQLTADVQDMLVNPAGNFGWLLKAPEIAGQAKRFESRESPGSEPVLTVIFAPAIPAAKTVVGAGCVGSSGLPFTLDALGLTPFPVLGDDTWGFYASNGPANGYSEILFSTGATGPQPLGGGCSVFLDLNGAGLFILSGFGPFPNFLDPTGAGFLPMGLPPAFFLAGFTATAQSIAFDASAPLGFVLSNALTLTLGV